ncbi:MAG TPA: hypothetical protein VKQ72_07285 [Aggregatilineales bacterium]|nr:hypothetical protein [Aggregatilineales bacterium]
MTNSSAPPNPLPPADDSQPSAPVPRQTDEPGFVDGIPVEELVRLTREFTARITNEDRQRLQLELSESGHQRSIQSSAPFLLQQFFTGKIDLDVELARRYPGSPLMSELSFTPEPGQQARHGFASFASQDSSAAMTIEVHGASGALNVSFLLQSMIAVRFALGATTDMHRRRFLELMRRPNGIAFLWTRERWERDYLIFVVREHFARVYAFGPDRFDGACRITPEGLDQLLTWLGTFWADVAPKEGEDLSQKPDPDAEQSPPDALSW